jgi:hypothetical protein
MLKFNTGLPKLIFDDVDSMYVCMVQLLQLHLYHYSMYHLVIPAFKTNNKQRVVCC